MTDILNFSVQINLEIKARDSYACQASRGLCALHALLVEVLPNDVILWPCICLIRLHPAASHPAIRRWVAKVLLLESTPIWEIPDEDLEADEP